MLPATTCKTVTSTDMFGVISLARVEEYLDAGCDVNCVDSSRTRNTPLHWAASYGSPEILQVLIGICCLNTIILSHFVSLVAVSD